MWQNYLRDTLIKELGLDNLSPEKKEDFLVRISQLIQQRLLFRLISEMDEKEKDEFDKLFGANDDEAIIKFLETIFPDLPAIIKEEIERFREEAGVCLKPVIEPIV